MATVRPTVKDVSRAIADLESVTSGALNIDASDEINRVARNIAWQLGSNVNLRKVSSREVALILASHGYVGDLLKVGRRVAMAVRGMADEYGGFTSQL